MVKHTLSVWKNLHLGKGGQNEVKFDLNTLSPGVDRGRQFGLRNTDMDLLKIRVT